MNIGACVASCAGDIDDVVRAEEPRALAGAGLGQVMILPHGGTRFDVLERVAKDVLPNV